MPLASFAVRSDCLLQYFALSRAGSVCSSRASATVASAARASRSHWRCWSRPRPPSSTLRSPPTPWDEARSIPAAMEGAESPCLGVLHIECELQRVLLQMVLCVFHIQYSKGHSLFCRSANYFSQFFTIDICSSSGPSKGEFRNCLCASQLARPNLKISRCAMSSD